MEVFMEPKDKASENVGNTCYYPSPLGKLGITVEDDAITRIFLANTGHPASAAETRLHRETWQQLCQYFSGQRKQFDIPLRPRGTAFQLLVWKELQQVPYGQTASYGQIARRIGNHRSVRAVAQAIGANGIGILIPCHRVIGCDRSLTGFTGGLDKKSYLLELERVNSL